MIMNVKIKYKTHAQSKIRDGDVRTPWSLQVEGLRFVLLADLSTPGLPGRTVRVDERLGGQGHGPMMMNVRSGRVGGTLRR